MLSIQLDDQAGWFDIQTDQIILSPNESEIISRIPQDKKSPISEQPNKDLSNIFSLLISITHFTFNF